jgi:hypothetical protein
MKTNDEIAQEVAAGYRTARAFSMHPCEIAGQAALQALSMKESPDSEKFDGIAEKFCEWMSKNFKRYVINDNDKFYYNEDGVLCHKLKLDEENMLKDLKAEFNKQ